MNAIKYNIIGLRLRFSYILTRIFIFNKQKRINNKCIILKRLITDTCYKWNEYFLNDLYDKWEDIFFLVCALFKVNYKAAILLYDSNLLYDRREKPKSMNDFLSKLDIYPRYWNLNRLLELHAIFVSVMEENV